MSIERRAAHRTWISNLHTGIYFSGGGEFEPNYLLIGDEKISRVNIIAIASEKYVGENFVSITLDDGSGCIQARAFKDDVGILMPVEMGDLVLFVGKPRVYQDELYLLPEIVSKIDNPNWELLRKVELFKHEGRPKIVAKQVQEAEREEAAQLVTIGGPEREIANRALEVIGQHSEFGISVEMIAEKIDKNLEETEAVVNGLLKEGAIYQDKPGHYKII